MRHIHRFLPALLLLVAQLMLTSSAGAQSLTETSYDIGSPTLTTLWVDPVNGNDAASGTSRAQAFRSVNAAWNQIPQNSPLSATGYRINLTRGTYPVSAIPNYWENRHGTYNYPIIFEAIDGQGTAIFQAGPNIYNCKYLYFINLSLVPSPAGDALHCELCEHILLRGLEVDGGAAQEAQETIKFNQSQYVYIEDSNIHGAYDNAIDFVAVQYGHIVRSLVHDAADWCAYVKGGSAYFRVEGNRFFDCGTGGFTTGQGTGFEFTTSPWIHYEAYNIKVINNVVHDTAGAGLGVNGGYNILLAHNTLYRVGSRSHALEVVFGSHSCDGNASACAARIAAGGWGTATTGGAEEFIPNRNVYVYNNVIYNPSGFRSADQHFAVYGARTPGAGSNIPSPASTDTNLRIRGNVIWNGPSDLPLGVGNDQGCPDSNPTCNSAQLLADNAINSGEPQLRDPAAHDFRPTADSPLFSATTYSIPDFDGGDLPTSPSATQGTLLNTVSRDRSGAARSSTTPPGAYATADADTTEPEDPDAGDAAPVISAASCTPKKVAPKSTVRCRATVSDDVGLSTVVVTFGGRSPRSMTLTNGAYRASWKAKGKPGKRWAAVVTATDTAGQTATRSAGRLKIK